MMVDNVPTISPGPVEFSIKHMRNELKNYIPTNKIRALVLGVSGGIDSTLCAALARPVCDELGIQLYGRSLPTVTNKESEVTIARQVGSAFCHDFVEVPIDEYFVAMSKIGLVNGQTCQDRKEKIRLGNIKARIRMIFLYDLAQKNDGMVLGTDNYTELMVGFWTLHGDAGDFGMIQNYWKTEVYEMSKWLADNETRGREALLASINAIPTDGLGITSSDLEQLGAKTYNEVDEILQEYFDLQKLIQINGVGEDIVGRLGFRIDELEKHPVIQRHMRTEFKRNNPYNVPKAPAIFIRNKRRFF